MGYVHYSITQGEPRPQRSQSSENKTHQSQQAHTDEITLHPLVVTLSFLVLLAFFEADPVQLAVEISFAILVNNVVVVAALLRHKMDFTTGTKDLKKPYFQKGEMQVRIVTT